MKNLVACFRTRFPGRTDRGWELPHPELDALVALADDDDIVLGGGEPTLRGDLPALLAALPNARLHTDGLAFAEGLRGLPLGRIRIDFHCARQDAHDWLVGKTGAARSAVRAIRSCLEAGLDVEVEVLLTRPTLPHLGETLDVLHRLGVRRARIRRIERRGPAAEDYIALSPRLARMRLPIEEAWREDMELTLLGVPRPGAEALVSERWHAPGEHPLYAPFDGYEALFGDEELGGHYQRGLVGVRDGIARLDLREGTSRMLRQRLIRLAEGHDRLEVEIDLERAEAPELLYDCLRLFESVDAFATGSSEHWSRADARHLQRLASLKSRQ